MYICMYACPLPCGSIGYAIAGRLLRDGARVMLSSRKEANVQRAVETLRGEAEDSAAVQGVVCHVGKEEHRSRLLQEVRRLGHCGVRGGRGRGSWEEEGEGESELCPVLLSDTEPVWGSGHPGVQCSCQPISRPHHHREYVGSYQHTSATSPNTITSPPPTITSYPSTGRGICLGQGQCRVPSRVSVDQ